MAAAITVAAVAASRGGGPASSEVWGRGARPTWGVGVLVATNTAASAAAVDAAAAAADVAAAASDAAAAAFDAADAAADAAAAAADAAAAAAAVVAAAPTVFVAAAAPVAAAAVVVAAATLATAAVVAAAATVSATAFVAAAAIVAAAAVGGGVIETRAKICRLLRCLWCLCTCLRCRHAANEVHQTPNLRLEGCELDTRHSLVATRGGGRCKGCRGGGRRRRGRCFGETLSVDGWSRARRSVGDRRRRSRCLGGESSGTEWFKWRLGLAAPIMTGSGVGLLSRHGRVTWEDSGTRENLRIGTLLQLINESVQRVASWGRIRGEKIRLSWRRGEGAVA